jgi:hypothetical protein
LKLQQPDRRQLTYMASLFAEGILGQAAHFAASGEWPSKGRHTRGDAVREFQHGP